MARLSVMMWGVAVLAVQTAQPQAGAPPGTSRQGTVRLTAAQARAIAPLVAALRVSPSAVRMRIGDSLLIDTLVVAALDSAGNVLGYLSSWDSRMRTNAAAKPDWPHRRVVGVFAGVANYTIGYSRAFWGNRSGTPPTVDLSIEIVDPSGAPPTYDIFCPRDADSVVSAIAHDYAGYADARRSRGIGVDSAAARLQHDALTAPSEAACTSAISTFIDLFRDPLLRVGRVAPGASPPSGSPPSRPSIKQLDDTTLLLTLPSFRLEMRSAIDSLIHDNVELLRRTPNLIVDVRGNSSGTSASYASLRPLLYTNPIRHNGWDIQASSDNADFVRSLLTAVKGPDSTVGALRRALGRMQEQPGQLVVFENDYSIRFDSVWSMPRKIALLVDRQCANACEEFVLEARQSQKVFLFGENTAGTVDYGYPRRLPLPSGGHALDVPAARSDRLPQRSFDWVGIAPQVRVSPTGPVLDFVARWTRQMPWGHLAPRLFAEQRADDPAWIAARYDSTHVLVFFDSMSVRQQPVGAEQIATPQAWMLDPMRLPVTYADSLQSRLRAEHFKIGDRYGLVLDNGREVPITVTSVVGYGVNEPPGNWYIGMLAAVSPIDLGSLHTGYTVARHFTPTRASRVALLASVPVDARARVVDALHDALRATIDSVGRAAAADAQFSVDTVQSFTVADGSRRYYVRGSVRSGDDVHRCTRFEAWLTDSGGIKATAIARSACFAELEKIGPILRNVVAVGNRVLLVVDEPGYESRSFALYEYRDGATLTQMWLLQLLNTAE